jgi:hypothetical protein
MDAPGDDSIEGAEESRASTCRVNSRQLQHAIDCQGVGDKSVNPNGSKMFPSEMEKSMRLIGTPAGEEQFKGACYSFMKMSPSQQPVFRLNQQLSAQQLKSYASKPRAALVKSLATVKEREARQEREKLQREAEKAEQDRLRAEDPDKYCIYHKYCTVPFLKQALRNDGAINYSTLKRKVDLQEKLYNHRLYRRSIGDPCVPFDFADFDGVD